MFNAAGRGFLTFCAYRAEKYRPASARGVRDEVLIGEIRRVHALGPSGLCKAEPMYSRRTWQPVTAVGIATLDGVN